MIVIKNQCLCTWHKPTNAWSFLVDGEWCGCWLFLLHTNWLPVGPVLICSHSYLFHTKCRVPTVMLKLFPQWLCHSILNCPLLLAVCLLCLSSVSRRRMPFKPDSQSSHYHENLHALYSKSIQVPAEFRLLCLVSTHTVTTNSVSFVAWTVS